MWGNSYSKIHVYIFASVHIYSKTLKKDAAEENYNPKNPREIS
jgi:hypothetical protein